MASLIDLRRRIRSVKNMQQNTKPMEMVSAARVRRAQERILATRPYALKLREITRNLATQAAGRDTVHPLLARRPENKVLLVVVSADKGLCGAFNAAVLRRSEQELRRVSEHELLLLGKRAADYHTRRRRKIRAAHRSIFQNLSYQQAHEIAEDIARAFGGEQYDAVYVIYNQFVSLASQKVACERVLPLETAPANAAQPAATDPIYEPSPETLLHELLPRFLAFQIYRVLLESSAAEHAARMAALSAATRNAGELRDRLTLQMNRRRQANITTELIEVISGAQALAG